MRPVSRAAMWRRIVFWPLCCAAALFFVAASVVGNDSARVNIALGGVAFLVCALILRFPNARLQAAFCASTSRSVPVESFP